jgi:drug/metabolite transporter (DMT)-like permease
MRLKWTLWLAAAFIALGVILWGATHFWQGLGEGVTGHGWAAYILGGVLTLGLSIGLFALSFYSARHGHDDAVPPHGEPE